MVEQKKMRYAGKQKAHANAWAFRLFGGESGTRTPDLRIMIPSI